MLVPLSGQKEACSRQCKLQAASLYRCDLCVHGATKKRRGDNANSGCFPVSAGPFFQCAHLPRHPGLRTERKSKVECVKSKGEGAQGGESTPRCVPQTSSSSKYVRTDRKDPEGRKEKSFAFLVRVVRWHVGMDPNSRLSSFPTVVSQAGLRGICCCTYHRSQCNLCAELKGPGLVAREEQHVKIITQAKAV